tara:strand:- start:764 stop:1054 length:291 start_codon:yes stop_codon:yes gene_type:complete
MPKNAGYSKVYKAGKGTEMAGAKALVKALAAKGIKAQKGLETKPLVKMTMGGSDLIGAMVAAQKPMKAGGEEYYKLGGTTGRSTYSGKKKKKKKNK